jgi:hypothetical protein
MEIAYVRIANPGDSKQIWIAKPYEINNRRFTTKTHCSYDETDYYTKDIDRDRLIVWITINKDKKALLYVECPQNEADYVILPYFNGTDFKKIVKRTDENTFIVNEKIYIETAVEKENGIKLPNGRDNEILGCIYKEHLPTDEPKYDGDMNTLTVVYNPRAKYIKLHSEI